MSTEQVLDKFAECDLFIAYYLKDKAGSGSESAARQVYKALSALKGPDGNPYSIFFLPESAPEIDSNETQKIASWSKAFLFVVDKDVPRKKNSNGNFELETKSITGELKRIHDEIAAFKNSGAQRKLLGKGICTAMLYVDGGYSGNPADNNSVEQQNCSDAVFLDPMFQTANDSRSVFTSKSCDKSVHALQEWLEAIVNGSEKRVPTNLFWVGTRQSDIEACSELFDGTICLFGENDKHRNHYAFCYAGKKPRVDHNVVDDAQNQFFVQSVETVLSKNKDALFYCYCPGIVHNIDGLKEYASRFLCINDKEVMARVNNKHDFRNQVLDKLPEVRRLTTLDDINYAQCNYNNIHDRLKADVGCRFILQAPVSSGGNGTFILDEENARDIAPLLNHDGSKFFMCSVYQEHNIPVNVHAIIYDDKIALSPLSIQLMKESDHRLMYRGADFIECKRIPEELRNEFLRQSKMVVEELQKEGYRGVCGVDGIITRDEVFILEVNNRFQASTGLINRALVENNLPTVQEMNLAAFSQNAEMLATLSSRFQNLKRLDEAIEKFSKLEINYSNFAYIDNETPLQAEHVFNLYKRAIGSGKVENFMARNHLVSIEDDGFGGDLQGANANAHLYRATFNTNIVWISEENTLYYNENVCDEPLVVKNEIIFGKTKTADDISRSMLSLKVALNIQGVVPDESLPKLRSGTFKAVDIIFKNNRYNNFIINAPIPDANNCDELEKGTGIKFIDFSPFTLHKLEDGSIRLYYFSYEIGEVEFYAPDEVATDGRKYRSRDYTISYEDIAYLSTDRLRVHVTNQCKFKKMHAVSLDSNGDGCKFCNISKREPELVDMGAISSILDEYIDMYKNREDHPDKFLVAGRPALRHYLVGGQSADLNEKQMADRLEELVGLIHSKDVNAPIYAMILPCEQSIVRRLMDRGLTDIAFNIEILDDKLAKKYMPGKGALPRKEYFRRLENAQVLFRDKKSVKSMLLIGLEPLQNTLNGVKKLVSLDVQPMLSIFRPLPGTDLADCISPPMEKVMELFWKAQEICASNGQRLGPDCVCCQNNTVSLPIITD